MSIKRQCELLNISRNRVYYQAKKLSPLMIQAMRLYEEIYAKDPCIGTRRICYLLSEELGVKIGRKKATRIRNMLNLKTLYPHKDTSEPAPEHKKYPHLLKDMDISQADQVWTSDITYLPVGKGHFYLCCVMDWASREILGWNFGTTMDKDFCLKALNQALDTGRCPNVFNTDQGSQYTSADWLNALESRGIKVSMDGRGRWQDNVRMERFWRSFKYEHYFLHGSESLKEIRIKGEAWIYYYNNQRPHSKLSMLSPVMWSITQSQTCTTPPRRSFFQQACTPLRSVPAC